MPWRFLRDAGAKQVRENHDPRPWGSPASPAATACALHRPCETPAVRRRRLVPGFASRQGLGRRNAGVHAPHARFQTPGKDKYRQGVDRTLQPSAPARKGPHGYGLWTCAAPPRTRAAQKRTDTELRVSEAGNRYIAVPGAGNGLNPSSALNAIFGCGNIFNYFVAEIIDLPIRWRLDVIISAKVFARWDGLKQGGEY